MKEKLGLFLSLYHNSPNFVVRYRFIASIFMPIYITVNL